ncbi:hypothetical protein AC578_4421 [Pseudocercospora eumusae]|uniref:Uncharacterized protein n=1 Tax=Pseudocercospora eumusae TaxID=321146 RepID=A0A139HEV7_9PEZI|nr:hypothetical protein AC578_4421 [Pseudocercospora eumusae]KXT01005.1 hypothetical protein AC578_4421 [Pseudocercospora eumusae]
MCTRLCNIPTSFRFFIAVNMSQLDSTLREAADKNGELLAELRQTDYAPSSLKQNKSYISDLKAQIANTDKELARLHSITEDERKDHVKYRDSNVKRYMYKMGGSKGKDKFASKAEKEEKEFLEAWQTERSAKEAREELGQALQKAEQDQTNLQSDTARHDKAQKELDSLYNSIFSGPTPELPGEDQMEENVKKCREFFDQCNAQLDTEKKALEILGYADQSLKRAYGDIQAALRRSGRDVFGGGTFTDMMERDALANAQNNVHAATRHLNEARRIQPAIKPLSDITIDQGHFFSDVMFDNIFTDLRQHERIQRSENEMRNAGQQLQAQVGEQRGRCADADRRKGQAGTDLEAARMELQRIRAEAFERVAAGGGLAEAPPKYQAAA